MISLWRLLANLNFIALYFFWTAPFEKIATKFDLKGQAINWMNREDHVFAMAGVMLLVNFAFFVLHKSAIGVKFLDYARFPNRDYWLSSPDRRLDAIEKMRALMVTLAVFVNVIFMQTQILLYLANFYKAAFTPKILFIFLGSVAVLLVGIFIWTRSLFQTEVQ